MATRWNFGMPAKGSVPIDRHKLSVKHAGKFWTGYWELEGDKLQVCSAYGSRTVKAGSEADPATMRR
jgi:hypothetical protein